MAGITHRKILLTFRIIKAFHRECMNPSDKKWYSFNDEYVREISSESIKQYETKGGSSPYILFYCKRSLL